MDSNTNLQEQRCPYCKRLLFKGAAEYVEIKCPRCKQIIKITAELTQESFLTGDINHG